MKTIGIYNSIDEYVTIPAKYVVCDRCEGEGHHGNPAFDGTSMEWWYENDPSGEELDAYIDGRYDVRCAECNGDRVVLTVDTDACTGEQLEDWYFHEQMMYEEDAEQRAWNRMQW